MITGFEGYLLGILAILILIAFLWRALGRHVTVNNNNSPIATANASSEAAPQQRAGRNLIGALATVGVLAAVFLFAALAIGNRIEAPANKPIERPIEIEAEPIPIQSEPVYTPVELPAVNTALDATPLIFLAGVSALLYFVMRGLAKPAGKSIASRRIESIRLVDEALTADLFTEAAKRKVTR